MSIWMLFATNLDAPSQLMKNDCIIPWRAILKKNPLFIQILVNALLKLKGMVANLIAATSIKQFVFALGFCLI